MFPIYYIPPEVPPPLHIRRYAPIALLPGIGPEGAEPAELGGVMIGVPFSPGIGQMLRRTKAGWWIAMGDAQPHDLARVRGIPGPIIEGKDPAQLWRVPTLLKIDPSLPGLTSSLPSVYRDYQWQSPIEFQDIQDRLGAYHNRDDRPSIEEEQQLAIDILAVNYHLSIHELAFSGWMDENFLLRVLRAAVDIGQ